MTIRVVAFARIREVLNDGHRTLQLADGSRVGDAWDALVTRVPELAHLESSTRLARNGRLVEVGEPLADGDELTLLPPVGGG